MCVNKELIKDDMSIITSTNHDKSLPQPIRHMQKQPFLKIMYDNIFLLAQIHTKLPYAGIKLWLVKPYPGQLYSEKIL